MLTNVYLNSWLYVCAWFSSIITIDWLGSGFWQPVWKPSTIVSSCEDYSSLEQIKYPPWEIVYLFDLHGSKTSLNKCIISEKSGALSKELKKEILKLATQYKQKSDDENFEPYIVSDPKD